ncbi:MAG: hypothetical protein GC149_08055 [Gammaproteobacteria bacterium]|nr:hypothetical protein [Gammaproteobacteria bacterium]
MDHLITQLDCWLRDHRSDYYKELNPPATNEELEMLEEVAGAPIPADFKKLLLWKNGQSSDCVSTFHPLTNEMFVSTSHMLNNMREMKELVQYGDIQVWEDGWAPFMDNGGGDVTCIDFKTGEIITRDHETEELTRLSSLHDWMTALLKELSTNNFDEWDFDECRSAS